MTSLNLPIVQQFLLFLKENENRSYDLLLGLYSRLEYIISEIKNSR